MISSGSNKTNATRNVSYAFFTFFFLREPVDAGFKIFVMCPFGQFMSLCCDFPCCKATRHAEMEAIDVLLREWQSMGLDQTQVAEKFAGCDLYVTCEPCIMCATALSIIGLNFLFSMFSC